MQILTIIVLCYSGLLFHCLHLFGRHGLVEMSEPALAVGSDEVVLLVAQAAEALELLYLVIVEEVLELALALPQVYQLGNEVDTGLDGEYEAGLQGTGQTHTSPRFSMSCTSSPIMWPRPQGKKMA